MYKRTAQTHLLIVLALAGAAHAADPGQPRAAEAVGHQFFETKVRPILVARCFECHADQKEKGHLRLDSRQGALQGGETGPAIVPGRPGDSLLVKAISHADKDLRMPPKAKLSDDEIATLTHWIKLGAPWPGGETTAGTKVRPRAANISDDDRRYWFFQPLGRPAIPPVNNKDRVANPIDAFLLEKLEAVKLSYSRPADKPTLIRRATFDLLGLPPLPQEVDAFLADQSSDAYEKLLDRLLASPRYGERQARLWLDLVRYADSDGFKSDDYRPHIWRYRDWVIDAFNADMPYDRFITAQLAGDEANPGDPASLIATGYLRLWPYEYNQRDVHKQWNEILDDITGNIGEVFLGLSMHCARCHNHKFDPILQEDYYKLRAFVAPILPDDSLTAATAAERTEYEKGLAAWNERTKDLRAAIEAIEGPHREAVERGSLIKFTDDLQKVLTAKQEELSPLDQQVRDLAYRQLLFEHKGVPARIKGEKKTELDKLYADLRRFDASRPAPLVEVTAVRDVGPQAPPTIIPGDKRNRVIEPGFLSVLPPGHDATAKDDVRGVGGATTGRRLALARWLTGDGGAMATRVIVNRLWQSHFGTGIVATGNDFGRQGDKPTHPALLDWLAGEFVARGWSMKWMHKSMMLSEAYQQASHGIINPLSAGADPRTIDPANTLLWHQRSRRLEAEQVRDAMLRAGRELSDVMYGPGIAESAARRSVYLKFMRNNRPEIVETFDGPDGFNSTSKRNVTTIAPQALMLLNGDWALGRARKLAETARSEAGGLGPRMVEVAYRQALGRAPTSDESNEANAFIAAQVKRAKPLVADPRPRAAVNVEGIAVDFRKGQQMRLADNPALKFDEFTIEGAFVLRGIDGNANVRTIASKWDGGTDHPGWALGVSGLKSKHLPSSLILQLVGRNEDGNAAYDVVPSNLKVELNKLYHVAVRVRLSQVDSTGIAFHLRMLEGAGEAQVAEVGHTVIKGIDNVNAFVIGGRDGKVSHGWDGILDDVRLYGEALSPQQLIGGRNPKKDSLVGDWRFAAGALVKDSSGKSRDLANLGAVEAMLAGGARDEKAMSPVDPSFEAFIDFCHVLLNSNEFLYVD
jgi:mono/diheme cytochrome c family protein